MSKERLYLFDTTLRDGAQTPGIDFTLIDKELVAELLDDLGVDYVEGGYPGANPLDTEFFSRRRTKRARFTAFGRVKRGGVSVSNDPGLRALLDASADAICFVAKAWDYQVRVALGITDAENVSSVRLSVELARAAGREVLLDCEHFFDGYTANPAYALEVGTAHDAWRRVVLCEPTAARCPTRSMHRSRCGAKFPGDHSAFMPITTPIWRSPIPLR